MNRPSRYRAQHRCAIRHYGNDAANKPFGNRTAKRQPRNQFWPCAGWQEWGPLLPSDFCVLSFLAKAYRASRFVNS